MHPRHSRRRSAHLSDSLERCCAGVIERLENRLLLSVVDNSLSMTAGTSAEAAFAAPRLVPESDTGISSTDGITSDSTPLIQIDIPQGTGQGIWATLSTATGVRYVELDPTTGSPTGRQFDDNWGSFYWSYGSALGEGRLYTVGATSDSAPIELRTYDIGTGSRISSFQIPVSGRPAGGLAYLNGKLYVADTVGFTIIDPATGAILGSQWVHKDNWSFAGTGPCLAASPDQNALYTVDWTRSLTKIDPATGVVLKEFTNFDTTGTISGLAYSNGKLYATDYGGQLVTIDPATGQRLATVLLNTGAGYPVALAGDGVDDPPYYRVFDAGVLISASSERSPLFQAPQLADGRHDLIVRYYTASGALLYVSDPLTVKIDLRAPERPESVAIDSASDTGISSSDGITSDTTPLFNVNAGTESTIWVVSTTETDGLIMTELELPGRAMLRSFTDPSLPDYSTGHGAAMGDGVLYVSSEESGGYRLRTYSLSDGTLLRNVPLSTNIWGLAYLNGKLYGANGDLMEIDPMTGAQLSRRMIYYPGGPWVGTGPDLAADNNAGVLYSTTFDGRLVKIDPQSSVPLAVTTLVNAPPLFHGLGFAQGKLIGSELDGELSFIDPATGQVTWYRGLPTAMWRVYGVAGEGYDTHLYYRVYSNGVQISGDYESAEQFQAPELSDGIHIITIKSVDAAGNVSQTGLQRSVRIITAAPAQPAAPTLDPSSDTGFPLDGITSDSTPLLQIFGMQQSQGDSIIRVIGQQPDASGQPGNVYLYLFDTQSRTILSQSVIGTSAQWDWAQGAAIGDGKLYVIRTVDTYAYPHRSILQVFDANAGTQLYEVPLADSVQDAASLAYYGGALYAGGAGMLYVVDPTTGEMLESIYPYQWNPPVYTGIGSDLAGADDLGRIFAIDYSGQFMSIDPSTGDSIVIPGYDRETSGMAYAAGELVTITFNGLIREIDPKTGTILSTYQFPGPGGLYSALAGDGGSAGYSGYYRVFADGVQISGDYERGDSFEMPRLADGKHLITIAYVDVAGNLSPVSGALSISVDTRAPSRPEPAVVDASSDTGVSFDDGITSDTTPLLNITLPHGGNSFWQVSSLPDGLLFVERDPVTGAEISRFRDTSVQNWTWAIGAALGDGVIYVAGADGELRSLRTYDLATGTLVRDVPMAQPIYGLAYLDGKLYAADSSLMEIDPTTGAVLSRKDIFLPDWRWVGTGASLTADNVEGVLYSVSWAGQLVKIDPGSSTPLAVIDNVDPERLINGLAFAGGNLIAITYTGRLLRIDPHTGQVTQIGQAPEDNGYYHGLAGEGRDIDVPTYYRVFSDGVQISGDYESAAQFQMPELSAGTHLITIRYVDAAGNVSEISTPTTICILSGRPAQPSAPTLASSSNSGDPADQLTNDNTPLIQIPSSADTSYYRVFADGVQVSGDYEQGGSFEMPQLADGEHSITIAYVDAAGNVSAMSEPLTLTIDTSAPVVQQVIVNDGSAQRSMVNQLTVVFSEVVELGSDGIQLTLADGSTVPGTQVTCTNPSGDGRTYVLTFSGAGVLSGSLADGLYTLSVNGASDSAGNQLASEFTYSFHRLFGDGAGDGSISREDLQTFIDSLSSRYGTEYTWYFDFDASGRISGSDLSEFIDRYVLSIQG